jgi:uncharacterized protein YjbJ (UPF0337 family)
LRTLRVAAEAGKKDAGIEPAAKQAKGSAKKGASKVTRGAKLEAKGKVAKAVGKKHALTKTLFGIGEGMPFPAEVVAALEG